MTSSTKPAGNTPSPIAAVALKLVGTITILAALVDFIVLLIDPKFGERPWLIATATQIVDRGIVPLVGIALLFTGFWIDSYLGSAASRRQSNLFLDSRFWACALSSLLGIVFLILTFIYPINVSYQSQQALSQVSEEAQKANTQLEQRLSQEVTQQRNQIDALVKNPELLNQAVSSGQVSQEQASQIEQFRSDPNSLDTFLNQQASQLKTQLQTEIGSRREQATKQVKTEALKGMIRISLSSLLLTIGYTIIGWTGLRRLLIIN